MESKQSLILCLVYTVFLILGAVMFMYLEYEVTEHKEVKELIEWTRLKELAIEKESPEDEMLALAMWLPKNCSTVDQNTIDILIGPGSQPEAVDKVQSLCPHLHVEEVNTTVHYPWSFIDALYFSMTVSTTIGYGHISPSLAAGRIMCMIYALVGIPLTGILLAWTSEFFGEQLFKLFKSKLDKEKQHSRKVIAAATFIYIGIGFAVFIFLPAIVFMAIENWTYLEGVYYAFITLTTIGFGDLVSGNNREGAYKYVYQVCVILWIMVGLGYWVMVANFITKALKSKHLQSSVLRSAEEMKKLMQQMGIKQQDPRFLAQHSKATLNFMLQLSNIIAVQGGVENGSSLGLEKDTTNSETPSSPGANSTASTFSPLSSPMGIPGISALFGPAMNRTNPLGQLIGPLGLAKYVMKPRLRPCDESLNSSQEGLDNAQEIVDGIQLDELTDEGAASSMEDLERSATESREGSQEHLEKNSSPNCKPSPASSSELHQNVCKESQVSLNLEEEPA